MPRSSCFQVRHGDANHGREAKNVQRNRIPLRVPRKCGILEARSGTDDKELYIVQFFDKLSHEWHGQFGLGHIDGLDQSGTRKLRPKLSQQLGAPCNDSDAIAFD
jgi:hypothetical protein